MRNVVRAIIAVFFISSFFALQGCAAWLTRLLDNQINTAFPPVTFEQVKKETLADSSRGLSLVNRPALLLNIPTAAMTEAATAAAKEIKDPSISISSVQLTPNEQGLDVTTRIRFQVASPRGEVALDLSGWVPTSLVGDTVTVRPLLRNVKLVDIRLEKWLGSEALEKLLAEQVIAGVNRYLNNFNGQIKPLIYKLQPSDIGLAGKPIPIDLGNGKKIVIPGVSVGNAAVLVDNDGLHVVANLESSIPSSSRQLDASDFEKYRANFLVAANQVRPNGTSIPGALVSEQFLTNLLTPAFTPVDRKKVAEDARSSVAAALASHDRVLSGFTIGANLLLSQAGLKLDEALAEFKGAKFGPGKVWLDDQTVLVSVPVTYTTADKTLSVTGSLGIAGILGPLGNKLFIRVLATDITVDTISHNGGSIAILPFLDSVNILLSQLIPYANSAFEPIGLDIPTPMVPPIKPPRSKDLVATPSIFSPPDLGRISLIPRVTKAGIQLLALEMDPIVQDLRLKSRAVYEIDMRQANSIALSNLRGKQTSKPYVKTSPEQLDGDFKSRWESALGPIPVLTSNSLSGAVSMEWLVDIVNRTLEKNKASLNLVIQSPHVSNDSGMIKFGGGIGVSCAQLSNCDRAACPLRSCSRNSCDWDCRRCGFWGCADDPFCKAGEAACNAREELALGACNLQANADKAACDTAETAKQDACIVDRELKRAGCDLAKEVAQAINNLSSLGSFKVDADVNGNAYFDNIRFSYSAQNATLELSLNAAGNMNAKGSLNYTPAGVGNVLICPTPGQIGFSLAGMFSSQTLKTSAQLSPQSMSDGSLVLKGIPSEANVVGVVSPAPIDALFTQNPQLITVCSPVVTIPLGIADLVGKISAYTPADILGAIERGVPGNQDGALNTIKLLTTGRFTQTLALDPIEIGAPTIPIVIGNKAYVFKPSFTGGNLQYSVAP